MPFRHAGRVILAAWLGVIIAWAIGASMMVTVSVQIIAWILTIAGWSLIWSLNNARRAEQAELLAIEDLIALKRFEQAAPRLHWLMLRPMRTAENRLRAMLLLATLLARMQRYDDALLVFNELIDVEHVAGPGGVMVKLGRTMTMLHADHLYDADRAINDLRRLVDRGGAGAEMRRIERDIGMADPDEPAEADRETLLDEETGQPLAVEPAAASIPLIGPETPRDALAAAGLRLVELYRDVKTGHSEEAIELFQAHRQTLCRGLGHRVGEALALAAVAYDGAGRSEEAARAFADATALQPVADLLNRYAEVRPLIARYAPTPAPAVS